MWFKNPSSYNSSSFPSALAGTGAIRCCRLTPWQISHTCCSYLQQSHFFSSPSAEGSREAASAHASVLLGPSPSSLCCRKDSNIRQYPKSIDSAQGGPHSS